MSYRDRIREMVFESPKGKQFTLQFDSLTQTGGKKAPVSEFPGKDQGAVQDLGNLTRTFPVSCYIAGTDYDLQADAFWEALHETGPGKLSHPRWGNHRVLAVPESQTEEFVNRAGRAVFSIVFIKAEEGQFAYPSSVTDSASVVSAHTDSAAEVLTESVPEEITDPGMAAKLKNTVSSGVKTVSEAFDNITGLTDSVREAISDKVGEITDTIDDLVSAPAELMTSLLTLYRYPGRVLTDVQEKIEAYKTIYSNLIEGFKTTTADYGSTLGLINAASSSALVVSASEACVYGHIATRTASSEIISSLEDFLRSLREDLEDMEASGSFVLDINLQIAMEKALSSALSGLIRDSLNLPVERVLTLDREVDTLTLTSDLYGSTDYLDDLLDYNNLQGIDRILVPRGREIRWYNAES